MIWSKGEQPAPTHRGHAAPGQQAVIDVLSTDEKPRSPKQLAEETGKLIGSIESILKKLEKNGMVSKGERGKYQLTRPSSKDGEEEEVDR